MGEHELGRFEFSTEEYSAAFETGYGKGYVCRSIPECLAFVTGLLTQLDSTSLVHTNSPDARLYERMNLPSGVPAGVLQAPQSWWFRGADGEYSLNSGIFRYDVNELSILNYPHKIRDHSDLDRRLRHEYVRISAQHIGGDNNLWETVAEMQHYGMPTRLLDWSYHLVTAAFFAVYYAIERNVSKPDYSRHNSPKQHSGLPTIWILNPRVLSGVFIGEYACNNYAYLERHGDPAAECSQWTHLKGFDQHFARKPTDPNWIYTWLTQSEGHFPVNATWSNARLAAQAGCFTIQGSPPSLDEFQESQQDGPRYLLKLRLDLDIDEAWSQLQRMGLNLHSIFPEREYITKSIAQQRGLRPVRSK